MSSGAAFRFKQVARFFGIIAVFSTIGPLAATAVFSLVLLVVGVPLLQLMLELVDLAYLRNWLEITIFLFVFFTLVATLTPSIVTGLIFALVSVYGGMNSLWAALIIAVCVAAGVVALGFFVTPSESSPLIVPSVKGLRQGAVLSLFLSVPAVVAASLSWLFSRPMHRTS